MILYMVGYIISSVIILVLALMIFSYITDPISRQPILEFFLDLKGKVKSNLDTIPTQQKNFCEENARKLLPDYLYLHNESYDLPMNLHEIPKDYVTPVINQWLDGEIIGKLSTSSVRNGVEVGENTNSIYYSGALHYVKKIIGKEGMILGYNNFTYVPKIVTELPLPFNVHAEWVFTNETKNNGNSAYEIRLIGEAKFTWDGFTEKVKEMYNISALPIIYCINCGSIQFDVFCSFNIESENGSTSCSGVLTPYYPVAGFPSNPDFIVSNEFTKKTRHILEYGMPTFFSKIHSNKIYIIKEGEFRYCKWVSED